MKKAMLIGIACVVVAALTLFAVLHTIALQDDQGQIRQVLAQNTLAVQKAAAWRGRTAKIQATIYLRAAGQIDASRCPEDFRLAWFDFQTAMQNLAAARTVSPIGPMLEGIAALHFANLPLAMKAAESALRAGAANREVQAEGLDEVHRAWRGVLRVALTHGVESGGK